MTTPLRPSLSPVENDPNKKFVFKPIQTPESLLEFGWVSSIPDQLVSVCRALLTDVSRSGLVRPRHAQRGSSASGNQSHHVLLFLLCGIEFLISL